MIKVRNIIDRVVYICLGVLPPIFAVSVFIYVFQKGREFVSVEFLTESPKGIPLGTDGGIYPAIIGTIYLGLISGAIGGLLAIFGAIYIELISSSRAFKQIIQNTIASLSGIPSIMFGLVGYTVMVYYLGMQRSLMTASITLAAMIYPFGFIRIQKILASNCIELMHASSALGLSKAYSIFKIILPSVWIEILSAVVLAMTYGIGAAAPVILTGAVLYADVPTALNQPFMSLTYHLYILANDGISLSYAYGTALVLMALILILNLICYLPYWLKDQK